MGKEFFIVREVFLSEGNLLSNTFYSIQITDIEGRNTYFTSNLKGNTNQITSDLGKGVYIVTITINNKTIIRKRIVII